jgi:hypothetical protein
MKIKTITITIALALITVLYSGCYKPYRLNGNGDVVTQTRQVFSFNSIESKADFNVYIEQDSIYQVTVQAESNLMGSIQTMVNGNTLVLSTNANLHNNYPINIYVKTPTLNNVTLSGSGIVESDTIVTNNFSVKLSGSGNMNGAIIASSVNTVITGSGNINYYMVTEQLATTISGSGTVNLMGSASSGTHVISGSGNLNSYNLLENYVTANISGSGNMYVNVSNQLNVSISGSGSVFYLGDPLLNINISGSGSVIKQ